jgi:hypothetical protein
MAVRARGTGESDERGVTRLKQCSPVSNDAFDAAVLTPPEGAEPI